MSHGETVFFMLQIAAPKRHPTSVARRIAMGSKSSYGSFGETFRETFTTLRHDLPFESPMGTTPTANGGEGETRKIMEDPPPTRWKFADFRPGKSKIMLKECLGNCREKRALWSFRK